MEHWKLLGKCKWKPYQTGIPVFIQAELTRGYIIEMSFIDTIGTIEADRSREVISDQFDRFGVKCKTRKGIFYPLERTPPTVTHPKLSFSESFVNFILFKVADPG